MKSRNSRVSVAVVATILGWMAMVAVVNAATDPGVRPGTAAGNSIPGLSADQAMLFQIGQDAFNELEGVGDGLGPATTSTAAAAATASPPPEEPRRR